MRTRHRPTGFPIGLSTIFIQTLSALAFVVALAAPARAQRRGVPRARLFADAGRAGGR